MALSVRKFTHALDCPEPDNQINVTYHPTSSAELCAGNGTPTAIFSYSNGDLAGVVAGDESANGANTDVCGEGMDVIFLVDYTGSMSGAINGVKAGISSLANTIISESGGNYRLGLVLYDEETATSPNYAASGYYQALPADQKINEPSPDQAGYNLFTTCVEKMTNVGNQTSFTSALNAIDSPNSNTGMMLGYGEDADEPAGRALYEIAAEGFAGSFRSGVQKLVILITDNITSESDAYWQNTLTPALNNAGIQLMVQVDPRTTSVNPTSMAGSYTYATENTQPQGFYDYTVDFTTTWTGGLELAISNLCQETFTYNCESIAIGWYMEDGTNTAQYWNGSTWSDEVVCEKTVVINLIDSAITDGGINPIETDHPYYTNSHKYTITAPIGTLFSLPNSCYADLGYTFNDITQVITQVVSGSGGTISVATDNGVATSTTNSSLANNEFVISGEVTHDMEFNVNIRANTSPETYAIKLTVIGKVDPSITPTGVIQPTGTTPSGWSTNFATTERIFVAEYGDTITWSANIAPVPSDYTYNVTGSSVSYSTTGIEFAFRDTYTLTQTSIGGTFDVPLGGGDATITLQGTIAQPTYTYELSATENITGASISETSGIGAGETYSGYTGAEFPFEIYIEPDRGYNPPGTLAATIAPGAINGLAVGTLSINQSTDVISGTLTMPSGAGEATINISTTGGSPTPILYTYTIDFVDPYDDTAYWPTITYTGAVDSFHATTHPLASKQADTSYTITGVTNDDSTNLVSTNDNTVDQELNIVLAKMPLGGGSATVTIEGDNSAVTYEYTVHFDIPETRSNWYWSSGPGLRRSITVSGTAGSQIEVNADQMIRSATDYTLGDISVTESSSNTSLSGWTQHSGLDGNGRTQVYGFTPKVIVTMPSGGGSSIVNSSAIATQLTYTFTVNAITDSSTSYVGRDTCGGGPGTGASTGSYGGAGSYIQFTGTTGQTWQAEFPAIANNVTDYRSEINSWSFNPAIRYLPAVEGNSYCGAGYDFVNGDFTMPSLDSRDGLTYDESILTIDDTVSGKTHTFTLTSNSGILNVSANQTTQTFTGIVGSTHNWQTTYSATEGYSFNITSVNESGSNISAVSVTDSTGTNIGGQITMPSGGGSATVTAGGTSNEITYTFTVTFSESISNAQWRTGGVSTKTRTVNLAPGDDITITEWLDTASGYEFSSASVSDNSSALTGATISSGTTSKQVSITITMPPDATSNQSGTVSVTGSTSVATRTLRIDYVDNSSATYISSGYGAGAPSRTGDIFSGQIGTEQTVTRYLLPESGYISASINSLSDDSTYVYGLSSGSGGGAGQAFYYTYEIPPTNQTARITINGTANYDCSSCGRLLAFASQTANSEGGTQDGVIQVSVHDGCIPEYSWTLNDTATTPVLVGPNTFEFRGLSADDYTIQLTDSNGCLTSRIVSVGLSTTTRAPSPTYYYYNATICPDAFELVIVRDTRQKTLGDLVTLQGTDLKACIGSSRSASIHDYTVQGFALDDGTCDCGPSEFDPDKKGPSEPSDPSGFQP